MLTKTKEAQLNKELFYKLGFIEDNIKNTLQEISWLKYFYQNKFASQLKPRIKSLKGIWNGTKIDEKDFKNAEKSLFPYEQG